MKRKPTPADILMWEQLGELSHSSVREPLFCEGRKWRFDFSIPRRKIAIEIEGGVWTNGAHVRGKHFLSDCEKYNHAALLGWRVLRFTPQQVLDGTAIAFIRKVLDS